MLDKQRDESKEVAQYPIAKKKENENAVDMLSEGGGKPQKFRNNALQWNPQHGKMHAIVCR